MLPKPGYFVVDCPEKMENKDGYRHRLRMENKHQSRHKHRNTDERRSRKMTATARRPE
jgi:hypothetical protein